MKKMRRLLAMLVMVMSLAAFMPEIPVANTAVGAVTAEAATPKLSRPSRTVTVGKSFTLKVKNTKKTVKWSSSKKTIATVSASGKVTGKKAGTCYIRAKVGTKTLKCKVTVRKNRFEAGYKNEDIINYIPENQTKILVRKIYKSGSSLKCVFDICNGNANTWSKTANKITLKNGSKTIGSQGVYAYHLSVQPGYWNEFTMTFSKGYFNAKTDFGALKLKNLKLIIT